MELTQLLNSLHVIQVTGEVQRKDVADIVYDSRKVQKNSVFVAIKGYKTDGHKFLQDAINKGAVAVVVEDDDSIKRLSTIIVKGMDETTFKKDILWQMDINDVGEINKTLEKIVKKLYINSNWEISLTPMAWYNPMTDVKDIWKKTVISCPK